MSPPPRITAVGRGGSTITLDAAGAALEVPATSAHRWPATLALLATLAREPEPSEHPAPDHGPHFEDAAHSHDGAPTDGAESLPPAPPVGLTENDNAVPPIPPILPSRRAALLGMLGGEVARLAFFLPEGDRARTALLAAAKRFLAENGGRPGRVLVPVPTTREKLLGAAAWRINYGRALLAQTGGVA